VQKSELRSVQNILTTAIWKRSEEEIKNNNQHSNSNRCWVCTRCSTIKTVTW